MPTLLSSRLNWTHPLRFSQARKRFQPTPPDQEKPVPEVVHSLLYNRLPVLLNMDADQFARTGSDPPQNEQAFGNLFLPAGMASMQGFLRTLQPNAPQWLTRLQYDPQHLLTYRLYPEAGLPQPQPGADQVQLPWLFDLKPEASPGHLSALYGRAFNRFPIVQGKVIFERGFGAVFNHLCRQFTMYPTESAP